MTGGPDAYEDPSEDGIEDELQDLVGSIRRRIDDGDDEQELDFSIGGKLPPDHPDADVFDDLDL